MKIKLRNKHTGEVEEAYITMGGDKISVVVAGMPLCGNSVLGEYDSLAELNEEWEDYKSADPLIKDEKIRKAVRAWAIADDLDNFRVQNQHFNECKIIGYTAGINKASFIVFQTTIAHADNKKLYTITELCGEEEE